MRIEIFYSNSYSPAPSGSDIYEIIPDRNQRMSQYRLYFGSYKDVWGFWICYLCWDSNDAQSKGRWKRENLLRLLWEGSEPVVREPRSEEDLLSVLATYVSSIARDGAIFWQNPEQEIEEDEDGEALEVIIPISAQINNSDEDHPHIRRVNFA